MLLSQISPVSLYFLNDTAGKLSMTVAPTVLLLASGALEFSSALPGQFGNRQRLFPLEGPSLGAGPWPRETHGQGEAEGVDLRIREEA